MDQWVKDTANQGDEPVGAKITMANWQQYKQFMPLGMQKLFEGGYYWKMPADIEMDVGPAVYNTSCRRPGSRRPRNTVRRLKSKSCPMAITC